MSPASALFRGAAFNQSNIVVCDPITTTPGPYRIACQGLYLLPNDAETRFAVIPLSSFCVQCPFAKLAYQILKIERN